jgi:hypothetical protein
MSQLPKNYTTSLVNDVWVCTAYSNCTPGESVYFDLTGSLSIKEDCRSEFTLQEISVNATEYTSSMRKGYEITKNVLKLTIPKS